MGVHRRVVEEAKKLRNDLKNQIKEKDKEKIYYLYFERLFSFSEMEDYFRGKYTYNELRDIIKNYYKNYYKGEEKNGR